MTPTTSQIPRFGRVNRWKVTLLGASSVLVFFSGLAALRLHSIQTNLLDAKSQLELARDYAKEGRFDDAESAAGAAVESATAASRTGHDPLFGVLGSTPFTGPQVKTVRALSDVALDVARAAEHLTSAAAKSPLFQGVSKLQLHGLAIAPLLDQIEPAVPALRAAQRLLGDASAALRDAPRGGVIASLAATRDSVAAQLVDARTRVDIALGLRAFGKRVVAGPPLRILLLSQNTWEIRPSGGFIGSYGVLTLDGAGMRLSEFDDATTFPPPIPAYAGPEPLASALDKPFGLAETGWWPDFPTSASVAAEVFKRSGGGAVDGVLGVTQTFLEDILRGIGGTVTVPGYPDVLTPENVSDRILYNVELKRPLDTPRKRFLALLTGVLFERLENVPSERSSAVAHALADALRSRHAQLWFADPTLNRPFSLAGWNGSFTPPHSDVLSVIDANMTASKANRWVRKSIVYRVYEQAGVLHGETTITTDHFGDDIPINHVYNSYLRVYTMKDARLTPTTDRERYQTAVSSEAEMTSLGSLRAIGVGARDVSTYHWVIGEGALRDGVYRLLVRPQASASADSYEIRIELGATPRIFRFTGDAGDQRIVVNT